MVVYVFEYFFQHFPQAGALHASTHQQNKSLHFIDLRLIF